MAQQKTILIIDDVAALRRTLIRHLKKTGILCLEAQDGFMALEILKKEAPDLILLDMMMPKMDGLEVCRRIKAQPRLMKIPILFITANASPKTILEGFKAGAVDYITKPFSPDLLLSKIQSHLHLN